MSSKVGATNHETKKPRRPKAKLNIPDGFQDILEQFAREVLIEQPHDLLLFGQQFFTQRITQRDGVAACQEKQGNVFNS